MDSGKEQNYWPGFVDALSNVVLTLVFVLVIFVFALVMASDKVEKKMQEVVQAENKQKEMQTTQTTMTQESVASQKEVAELRQELAQSKAEIEKLSKQIATSASTTTQSGAMQKNAVTQQNDEKHIAIDEKNPTKQYQGAIDVKRANNSIVLGFPLQTAEMDDKSATELGHVLEAMQKNAGKHKVLIRAIVGREAYSAARRLAYYRAIGARNYLVTKGGESPSNITMSIVQPNQPEDGRVEIVFQKE